MAQAPMHVLFLCTGNSARSIMAESVLRKDGAGRFRASSAGSHPKGQVNPLALEALVNAGYPTQGLRSKSWQAFAAPDAPAVDAVITVCDNAAGEACPIWPGHPLQAHWGIEDPATVEGPDAAKRASFEQALHYLKLRIGRLIALPFAELPANTLQTELHAIGNEDGASPGAAGRAERE